jgi:hypothetical protein
MIDQEKADRVRVLWKKARNFYSSFFAELGDVRAELGNDEEFIAWCDSELRVSIGVISEVAGVLQTADRRLARAELFRAKAIERLQKKRERDAARAAREARDMEKIRISAEKKARERLEKNRAAARTYSRRKKAEKLAAYVAILSDKPTKSSNCTRPAIASVTENIVKFPDLYLAAQLKDNLARDSANRAQWIDLAIERAALLCEARSRLPSNKSFGEWLEKNEIYIKEHDREALLNLGLNPGAMRGILEGSNRISYQLIWRDVQRQIPA